MIRRNSILFLFVLLAPAVSFAEDTAGQSVVKGTARAVGGVVDGTVNAVGAVATGAGKVVTGTANVVSDGAHAVVGGATAEPIDPKTKAALAAKVNCQTAPNDIALLEKEKASTLGQLKHGVKSVLPVTAAVRVLSGNYRDGVDVAAGQYNSDLEAKIASIKTTCNIN